MNEYEFVLKFRLPDADMDPDHYVGALIEAGCDDATIGIGQRGRIALDFTREADSALDAITSAIRAVNEAIPGATLVEAAPDLVGLTDVANLLGCTRQNIRKLMVTNTSSFPVAVYEGTQSIWHLHSILGWMGETQKRPIDHSLIDISEAAMQVNIAKEARHLPGTQLPKNLKHLFH